MSKIWPTKNLGDVCNIIGGGTPSKKKEEYYGGDIPWATVRDMKNSWISSTEFSITSAAVKNSSTNIIPAGNVVIATRVGLGKVCLLGQDTAINQDLRGVIPKSAKNLDVGFLFWWLKSVVHIIVAEGTGATVQGVKLPFVKSLQIPVPPLPEQKRIVAILDEAFAGIDAAVANTEKNLANARELFEGYLNAVFTRKGKGWVETTLLDSTDLITCGVAARPKYVDQGIPFLSAKNVKRGKVIWDDYKFVSKETHDRLTKHNKPNRGDILYTRVGSFGEAAIIDKDIDFSIFVSLTLIKPKSFLLNTFLKHYLNSTMIKQLATQSISGSGVGNLNVGTVRKFPISLPPIQTQRQIVEKIDALQAETLQLESIYQQKLDSFAELKQSILQKAFAGELTALPGEEIDGSVA